MSSTKEAAPEHKIPADIAEFKNQIGMAGGTLIPLARKAKQGTSLSIAVRYVANPMLESSPDAEEGFYGWDVARSGTGPFSGVVLVDAYTQQRDEIVPVGHMDWWLQGDYANGGGNEHAAVIVQNEHERRALERWGGRYDNDPTAFKVDDEYQGQGIGSLMLAASSVVLPTLGITRFYSGALLDPAVSTYARFGIHPDDFPKLRHSPDLKWWQQHNLPIEHLSQSPYVDEAIGYFLQTTGFQTE